MEVKGGVAGQVASPSPLGAASAPRSEERWRRHRSAARRSRRRWGAHDDDDGRHSARQRRPDRGRHQHHLARRARQAAATFVVKRDRSRRPPSTDPRSRSRSPTTRSQPQRLRRRLPAASASAPALDAGEQTPPSTVRRPEDAVASALCTSRSSRSGRPCSRRSPPASTRSTPCCAPVRLSVVADRRAVLELQEQGLWRLPPPAAWRASSLAWLRLELSPDGRLHAGVKAHKDDRAEINAAADVPATGLDAARASHLLAQCLKPAALSRRAPAAAAATEEASEQAWKASTALVAAALESHQWGAGADRRPAASRSRPPPGRRSCAATA